MTAPYDVGDRVRIQGTFVTSTGGPGNPSGGVILSIKDPSGNVVVIPTSLLTNPATGTFRYDFTIDESGSWYYRMTSTGSIITAGQDWFPVNKLTVP